MDSLYKKNKSQTFEKFKTWHSHIQNIYNHKIKFIRTDNGTEFSNNIFNEFCNSQGIIQKFTIPYNSEMNGRSERLNGTLIATAKSMLNGTKLSINFGKVR